MYGELEFEHHGWGSHDPDAGFIAYDIVIDTHPCSDYELGLTDENIKYDSEFFPMFED